MARIYFAGARQIDGEWIVDHQSIQRQKRDVYLYYDVAQRAYGGWRYFKRKKGYRVIRIAIEPMEDTNA